MFALVTTAFLLAGASGQGQTATPAPSPASAPVAAGTQLAPEKKVCRREQELGSIMPKRTCRTQAEWDAIARSQQGTAESVLRDARSRSAN